MFLETLLSDCSDVFLYKPFFPGEERTHFTCSSPHSAPCVRVRCGEGKIGGGIVGFCWNVVSQTWQKWVQCDVGLANLVYTRLRALWRSGGAIRRERGVRNRWEFQWRRDSLSLRGMAVCMCGVCLSVPLKGMGLNRSVWFYG